MDRKEIRRLMLASKLGREEAAQAVIDGVIDSAEMLAYFNAVGPFDLNTHSNPYRDAVVVGEQEEKEHIECIITLANKISSLYKATVGVKMATDLAIDLAIDLDEIGVNHNNFDQLVERTEETIDDLPYSIDFVKGLIDAAN